MAVPAILIFDVGKTNKKALLFDEQYKLLHEESAQLEETVDEDGFPCEDVNALTNWVQQKFLEMVSIKDIDLKAVNFSAYGASFVHIDKMGKVIPPLYNYLKPFPEHIKRQFYDRYGGEDLVARETASPVLGSLNSGMQLYRLKYEKPEVYEKISYSLHLPQYLSFILTKTPATDISSVGCHTNLWDFTKNQYHDWVNKEELDNKFAPLYNGDKITGNTNGEKNEIPVGIGLHDSSAALIPYLSSFHEPFVLISTGTWCISLNPFNHAELTNEELKQDCLCYLSYEGKPVKASRLFAGYQHEQHIKRLAAYFHKAGDYYQGLEFDARYAVSSDGSSSDVLSNSDLCEFNDYEEAYHLLVRDIVMQQVKSTNLVLKGAPAKKIFVDGGFAKNRIYMTMLANSFRGLEIYAATISQASALGAGLAIHKNWNNDPLPADIITLKPFRNTSSV
ncbi:MAG TPA: FGGY family carbohydrate kinase [Chitinophagaceae bacterium]|jgi:sugar (pentulose or hexulose) kinase|nr:FGGY family carbohydrate kinase [Chitinophagaceae bacterium]